MKRRSGLLRGWIGAGVTCAVLFAGRGAVAPHAHAESASESLPDAPDRLLILGRIWAKVRFFHPYVAYKPIDWDGAMIAAIPKVEAATSVDQYRAAVQELLAVVGDPVTTVIPASAGPVADGPAASDAAEWLTRPFPDVLKFKTAALVVGTSVFFNRSAQIVREAATAKVLIVDLRGPDVGRIRLRFLHDAFPAIDQWPPRRTLEHHGFHTEDRSGDNGFFFARFVTDGARSSTRGAKTMSHVVFIADSKGALPDEALALQAAGRATIVAQDRLDEAQTVATTTIDLPGPWRVRIRLSESLWGPTTADVTVPNSDGDIEARALDIAKARLTATATATPRARLLLPEAQAHYGDEYPDEPFPSRARRIFAGLRIWTVLSTFHPVPELMTDWDAVAREMVPRLADAADRDAYIRLVRQMSARINDTHMLVTTTGPGARARGMAAVWVRLIEQQPTVVRLLDPADAARHGIVLGDVLETINGQPAEAALAAKRLEVSGSNEEARSQYATRTLFAGDDGTSITARFRRADGSTHEETLQCTAANRTAMLTEESSGAHWKLLPGNIAYVDLRALLLSEVERMFEAIKGTRAIVFDQRGYVTDDLMFTIAPRLNTRHAPYAAQFLTPLVTGTSSTERLFFRQGIPPRPADAAPYTGKIVVLIDDRAASAAEHVCLHLDAIAGATFVGSPTAGANGSVSNLWLPGGLYLRFTAQEVRHADGRPLQGPGIEPNIVVRPTLKAFRAGKDELLDQAVAWISSH